MHVSGTDSNRSVHGGADLAYVKFPSVEGRSQFVNVKVRQPRGQSRRVDAFDNAVLSAKNVDYGDQGAIVHILGAEHCIVECVDSSGLTSWLADFHVDELAPSLDRWKFDVREVSATVYRAVGIGPRNMHVESTDTDPEKALAECRAFALRYPSVAG